MSSCDADVLNCLSTIDRQWQSDLPPMDALKFCNEKYLVCGSDSPGDKLGGEPAIVQIWDIDALANLATFPAHDKVREVFLFALILG